MLYNCAYQHFEGLRRLNCWLCNSSTNRRKKSRVRLLIVSFKLYHYSIARAEKIRTEYLLVNDPAFTAQYLQTDSEYVSQFTIVY